MSPQSSVASRFRFAARIALGFAFVAAVDVGAQSAPRPSGGQSAAPEFPAEWPGVSGSESACRGAIPREHMFVAPVLLRASLADSENAALSVQGDLIAQDVAQTMLSRLGATPGELPDLDSTLAPVALPARLVVTFRPDGSASRRAVSMSGDTSAATMLTRAFDALRSSGEGAMVWPEGYRADSIILRLELESAIVTPERKIVLVPAQHPAFKVFRLLAPPMRPALVRPNQPPPHYPSEAENARVEAAVELHFVVDTNGRADPESMSDVREWSRERMTPEAYQYLDAFIRELRKVVLRWHFTPARIDMCPVRQWVDLPVKFAVPGR